ncbi:toll-like receptor 7 isoform X2 [Hemiscyllium ocellatum]|uniref:toll-like receptor 7 isoform X2 n=1 Tax=Hemiscyllium ocellatum TaxID=170820 RepID=UPI0029672F70|nr:toll-like receptor 7 isoform X2 [Hemiscyllium ocellatum]
MVKATSASALILLCFLFLLKIVVPLTPRWIPRSLPCDVSIGNNGSSIQVDCRSNRLQNIPANIPANTTSLNLADNQISYISSHHFSNLQNLTKLDLSWNLSPGKSMVIANDSFSSLRNLQELYLDQNHLDKIPKKLSLSLQLLSLNGSKILNVTKEDLPDLSNIETLHLSQNCYYHNPCNVSNHIGDGAFSSGNKLKTLSLGSNNLTSVPRKLPETLSSLYLHKNKIQIINHDDFEHLIDLEYLDLSQNCPRCFNAPFPCEPCPGDSSMHIHLYAFQRLSKLQTLILSSNSLHKIQSDWFQNCTNLKVLHLQMNFLIDEIATGDFLNYLPRLEELDLSFNYKITRYLKNINLSRNFSKLVALRELIIKGYVFKQLESQDLKPLYVLNNLTVLNLGTNFIKQANLTIIQKSTSLKINLLTLDLSHNYLTIVPDRLYNCTKSLQKLLLKDNKIIQLPISFFTSANRVKYLDLSYNEIKILQQTVFPTSEQLFLEVLVLKGNPFYCICELVPFIAWINTCDLDIPQLATDVTCESPESHRGQSIILLDQHTCAMNDLAASLSLASAIIIFCTLFMALTHHLFYWDVWYLYNLCTSKLNQYQYRTLKVQSCSYDAFIAYDTSDLAVTDWVVNELLVHLEDKGERQFCLCLEERDWELGMPVVENLSQSIHKSKKTVFLLTRKYVKTGTFKTAFYMAHQRLMDKNEDVIVLILLEPVLINSKYLKLRKRLCRSSVLHWPKNPNSEDFFWQCLRNAITANNKSRYNTIAEFT